MREPKNANKIFTYFGIFHGFFLLNMIDIYDILSVAGQFIIAERYEKQNEKDCM